jgi:hypothetical protein
METPTLNYQSAPVGEPLPRQLAAARILRFWTLILILFALLLAVALIERFVIQWEVHYVLAVAGPLQRLYERHYTYSIVWRNILYIAPVLGCLGAMAGVYLALSRRLARRAGDRPTLLLGVLLTMLHTLAAAACVLLFLFVGGATAALVTLSWRSLIDILICILALAMVPGMFWTCVRFMDLLQTRTLPHRPSPSAPVPLAPPAPPPPTPESA